MPKQLTSPRDLIKHHEGLRLSIYKDTKDILTIGYGRNLEGRGITHEEAEYLFANDFSEALKTVNSLYKEETLKSLSPARFSALLDLAFNLGLNRLAKFVKFKANIEGGNFKQAAFELKYNSYPGQTPYYLSHPQRAERLMKMLETGEWPEV